MIAAITVAPSASWPLKPTKPSTSWPRHRLGDVVEEGAEAQRGGAVHLVGERLGEHRGGLLGAVDADVTGQVGLDRERAPQHLERVPVDVEVVVGALADALRRLQLGEDDGGEAELVEQRQPAQRVGAAEQPAQLGQLALAGGLGGAGGGVVGEGDGAGIDPEAELRRRGGRRAAGAAGPRSKLAGPTARSTPRSRSTRPSKGSIASPAASGTATAPTVKSRAARSASIAVAAQHGDVDLPAARPGDDAPGAELGGELEGVLAELAAERLGDRAGIAGDGEVEVADLAPERRVADRAAGDPDLRSPSSARIAACASGAARRSSARLTPRPPPAARAP